MTSDTQEESFGPPTRGVQDRPFQNMASSYETFLKHESSAAQLDSKYEADKPIVYPSTAKLVLLLTVAALSTFLVALDTTIVSTAVPVITDEFHSLDDVAWYGSGFFMTMAAFQSAWGKAYKYFSIKTTFILAVFIFEVGSLICALAPNSTTLVIGRAIAGVGGAGISSGCYIIVGISAPPEKTPALLGIVAASFAVASVAGPLLGGVFTEKVTWRWCFYINLPIGGVGALIILFFFNTPDHIKPVPASWKEKILQMDILGTSLLLGAIISFLLALQWGGVTKSWSSGDVIGTLVAAAVLIIAFAVLEVRLGERAAVNTRLLRNRTIALMMIFQVCVAGCFFVLLYELPIYFQAVFGVDAAQSGVRTIPLVAGASLLAIAAGLFMSITGEFQLLLIGGCAVLTVGSGLVYTLDIGSSSGKWIGYQVIVGVSLGCVMQVAVTVNQNIADSNDVSTASAMALFFQLLGGAIWLAVGQSLFTNRLMHTLTSFGDLDPARIVSAGATELRQLLSGEQLEEGLKSYMAGLKDSYALCIALAGASCIIGIFALIFDRKKLSKGVVAAAAV